MKFKKRYKVLIGISILIVLFIIYAWYENNTIVITEMDYANDRVPSEFDGFVIAHISDLHNKEFGNGQKKILKKLKNINPDIIVITGDIIDRRTYNLEIALDFVRGAKDIAPIYYVSGNHEASSGKYNVISSELIKLGVNVLDNVMLEIEKEGRKITLAGIKDPIFLKSDNITENIDFLEETTYSDEFKILLSHRPELLNVYANYNIDLVFTGHAHGGQINIPFIGPLYAPQQGLLPKFVSGSYKENNTTMIVSRGLGNSLLPFRINNKPEIVVVNLKNEK
jgi:Predicted phosphohydrolases